MGIQTFMHNAMRWSTLLQGFERQAVEYADKYDKQEKAELRDLLTEYVPKDPCEAGAKAIILAVLDLPVVWSCCNSPMSNDDILHNAAGECPYCNTV